VQGRLCEELISKWLSHPYLLPTPPKFIEVDTFDDKFLEASLAFARDRRLPAVDVLCSANHFLAQCLGEAVRRFLPNLPPLEQVWASGGVLANGLLWKLLRQTLAPANVERTDTLGIPSDARSAVHAGLLAYLTTENLAGNIPTVTGAQGNRVLGAITPG